MGEETQAGLGPEKRVRCRVRDACELLDLGFLNPHPAEPWTQAVLKVGGSGTARAPIQNSSQEGTRRRSQVYTGTLAPTGRDALPGHPAAQTRKVCAGFPRSKVGLKSFSKS